MPQWTVIGVPIDSVGRAGGTEHAPAALRERDLVARVGADDRGDLDVVIRGDARDPETGVVGIAGVLATTTAVRAAVREAVSDGRRPLLLGGCCALVPGALAGLRDAVGALGVAYVDGHVDVYDGRSSPTGEAADMPMGVAFGLGPDVVGAGRRRPERGTGGRHRPRRARSRGGGGHRRAAGRPARGDRGARPGRAARRRAGRGGLPAAARLSGAPFWIHLDVDVLDERAMPATDYLMPGGLEWDELAALLRPLCASPALAGLSLGCVNPEKDPDGAYVERTCALLAEVLPPRVS